MEVKAVDIPQAALSLHDVSASLPKVFPRIHTLGLSLRDIHKADVSSPITCVNSFATLLASGFGDCLQHLRLKDFPVLVAHPHCNNWKLQPLQRLTGLKSLELRLKSCLPRGCSASLAQLAQASLLSTLAPLQHLTSLTLCLLDLQAFPLHTQGQGPDVQDTSENEGGKCSAGELTSLLLCGEQPNFVFSSESSDISNVPTLVDADDGPDVDVDLEEAQHASHEAPDVESLLPLARSLRVLRLEHCVMRHRTLDQLCRGLTNLEDLTLSGSLGLSHSAIRTLAGLTGLRSLSLGSVQLIFEEDEDCPESVMSALYGSLENLPDFQSLSFTLATLDNTRWLHTAYTLGLYEHAGLASTLRALELNTVIFDCDYSLLLFAELTALTSLRMCYQTWPLSLGQEDLKLLAPLHNLRELKLLAHAQEEHQLLALTNGVLDTWRVSFQHLTCLHFSGLILFKDSSAPELAHFLSLRDLSLTAVADLAYQHDISYFMSQSSATKADAPEECSNASRRATLGAMKRDGEGDREQWHQSFRHRAAKGALYLGWSLGPSGLPDLHVPSSIPTTLTKLALSGFALCMHDHMHIANLPWLTHLQLSHPGLRPEQLLLTNTSNLTRSLELLALASPAAPLESMQRHLERRPAVAPWRLWCAHGCPEAVSTKGTKSSAVSTANHARNTCTSKSAGQAEPSGFEELLGEQAPWWVSHEASLMALALAQLGQLHELKHLQVSLPCCLPSNMALSPQSLHTINRRCTWSKESVLAALGDKATQLRSLRVLL